MEKFSKNIVSILSIGILSVLTIFNLFFIVTVTNFAENVLIEYTTSIGLTIMLVLDIILLYILKFLNRSFKINYKVILICAIIIYATISIMWVNNSKIEPIDDSKSVNDLAICLASGDKESIRNSEYIEKYPNQIGMITIFAFFYKIFGTTNFRLIQYLNIIANILTIIFGYFILEKLSKRYNINKFAYFGIIMTFIPFIMLTTYVYGDYIGLSFSVIGIYFIIDYKETNKFYKFIISSLFMSIAYFVKMNYIIVTIAILIYLILYLIQEKDKKKIGQSVISIIVFILIAILPFSIVKKIWSNKYEYKAEQAIPTSVWIYLGMSESYRANGWYSDLAGEAWVDTPNAHYTYPKKIKARIQELIKHPVYTFKFYVKKTISGWSDPYFQSLWYNVRVENKDENMQNIVNRKIYKIGAIYQKACINLIYLGALIGVLANRKKMSHEFILLLTIFIGGILFHTIWEMKSRYTLPYILMLIPISTIGIQEIVKKIKFREIGEIK